MSCRVTLPCGQERRLPAPGPRRALPRGEVKENTTNNRNNTVGPSVKWNVGRPPHWWGAAGGRGGLGFGQQMELGQNDQISGTQPLQRGRCRGFCGRDPCTWRLLYATIQCKIKKTPCVCKPHPVLMVAREGLLGTPAVAMRDCRSSSGSPLLLPSGWCLHRGLFGFF